MLSWSIQSCLSPFLNWWDRAGERIYEKYLPGPSGHAEYKKVQFMDCLDKLIHPWNNKFFTKKEFFSSFLDETDHRKDNPTNWIKNSCPFVGGIQTLVTIQPLFIRDIWIRLNPAY